MPTKSDMVYTRRALFRILCVLALLLGVMFRIMKPKPAKADVWPIINTSCETAVWQQFITVQDNSLEGLERVVLVQLESGQYITLKVSMQGAGPVIGRKYWFRWSADWRFGMFLPSKDCKENPIWPS